MLLLVVATLDIAARPPPRKSKSLDEKVKVKSLYLTSVVPSATRLN